MTLRALVLSAAALLPAAAFAAPPAKPAATPAKPAAALTAADVFHRVELKGPQGGPPLPYTVEVPAGWEPRMVAGFPGLWIGPADAKPPEDPRLVWVRGSQVPMDDPSKIAANIRANDEHDPKWAAPRVEVKDVGGVKALLVQMDTGEGDKARSSLTLKLPLEKFGVDFVTSDTRADFPKQAALYERILLSVRPLAGADAAKK